MTLPGHDLDTLLATSKPDAYEYDPALRTQVREVSIAAGAEVTRESSRRRAWWGKPRVVIGVFGVILLGTTGGAMASHFNSAFMLDGKITPLDAEIPIYYVTGSDVIVHCTVGLHVGNVDPDADVSELKSFVADHDWAGTGQRLYETAIRNPFTPGPNDDIPPDVPQPVLDSASFTNALSRVIYDEFPPELRSDGTSLSLSSNCEGKLR